jgi:quinol monooxygenase YgiN
LAAERERLEEIFMPSPTKITAILTARPGKAEELKALLVGMAPHCRAEPGNLRWDIWQDQYQSDCYVLDELYVDDDAVAMHRETPHYRDYLARIPELADRTALVLRPITVEQATP